MEFFVDPAKVTNYLLKDPGKAKIFTIFGYHVDDWQRLRDDIVALAFRHQRVMRLRQVTLFGREYEIVGQMATPVGRMLSLCTAWFLDDGETIQLRFVTAYPAAR